MYNSILSRDKLNNINLFKKDNDINQYIQELDKSFENKENIGDKKESSSIEPDYGESEFWCNRCRQYGRPYNSHYAGRWLA